VTTSSGASGASGASGGSESTRAREHLANERTLLAWVRTAVALMGLGFVVARFGLFLRQLALERAAPPEPGHASTVIGAALVASSVVITAVSTVRFFRARAQIEQGRYEPEAFTEVLVVGVTVVAGLALLAYLLVTG
jgi:putative membrane protein